MKVEDKQKVLYKIELRLLKVIPMLLALCYLSNTILSLCEYDSVIFSILGGMSVLPLIFLYVSSYVFKFCAYHRMFLHYIVVNDVINWFDYTYGIPMSYRWLVVVHIAIAGIFLFLILYFKFKVCKKQLQN